MLPTIELKVSLTNGALDVEEIPDGGVARGDAIQVISWYLDPVTLPDAFFELPTGSPRPFTWISTPHWNIFDKPVLVDPRRLELEDSHIGSGTTGKFIYLLRVRKDASKPARYYTTGHTSDGLAIRVTDNPVIINK